MDQALARIGQWLFTWVPTNAMDRSKKSRRMAGWCGDGEGYSKLVMSNSPVARLGLVPPPTLYRMDSSRM